MGVAYSRQKRYRSRDLGYRSRELRDGGEAEESSSCGSSEEDTEDAQARLVTKLKKLHEKWSKDPGYREAYDALADEFALAATIADARSRAGLTQAQVAERMHTSQSNIARLEACRTIPSTRTLERFANAIGARA